MEEVPADKPEPEPSAHLPFGRFLPGPPARYTAYDDRAVTLQLDLETVQVHHVQAVSFTTKAHSVRRHRSKKDAMQL